MSNLKNRAYGKINKIKIAGAYFAPKLNHLLLKSLIMKKNTLLFFVLFVSVICFSQNTDSIPTLFEVADLPIAPRSGVPEMETRFKNMMANPMNIETRAVRFRNLSKMASEKTMSPESPSYFKFSLPRGKKTKGARQVLVVPTHIEARDNGGYTYVADLMHGKITKGSLVLIHENGKDFGSMTLGDRTFRIESTPQGSLLVELNKKMLNSKEACGTDHTKKRPSKSKKTGLGPGLSSRATNASRTVRVLVLFTDAADKVSDPVQLAATMMSSR